MASCSASLDPEIHTGLRAPQDLVDKGGDVLAKEGMKLNKTLMGRVRSAGIKEIPIKSDDLVGRAVLTELVDPRKPGSAVRKKSASNGSRLGANSWKGEWKVLRSFIWIVQRRARLF